VTALADAKLSNQGFEPCLLRATAYDHKFGILAGQPRECLNQNAQPLFRPQHAYNANNGVVWPARGGFDPFVMLKIHGVVAEVDFGFWYSFLINQVASHSVAIYNYRIR